MLEIPKNPLYESSWEIPPQDLHIASGQIQVWRAQLHLMIPQLDTFIPHLSQEERDRGNRLVKTEHRCRFLISHAILRLILSRYLGQPPNDIQLQKGPHGKPYLEDQPLQFNMTHSNDIALYAITACADIGIDVEYVKRKHRMDALVKRFFSKREYQEYQSFPEGERHLAFYRAWTRKEAYLKATGLGLSYPLDHFDVSLAPEGTQCLLHVEDSAEMPQHWTLFSFEPCVDYLSSIAIKAPVEKLITYGWGIESGYLSQ